jgi:hypothetical protein
VRVYEECVCVCVCCGWVGVGVGVGVGGGRMKEERGAWPAAAADPGCCGWHAGTLPPDWGTQGYFWNSSYNSTQALEYL